MGFWHKPISGIVILFWWKGVMTRNARLTSEVPAPRRTSSVDDHGLDADQRGLLGTQLRAMFQQIVTEPLPDRFQRLLDELARKERINNAER